MGDKDPDFKDILSKIAIARINLLDSLREKRNENPVIDTLDQYQELVRGNYQGVINTLGPICRTLIANRTISPYLMNMAKSVLKHLERKEFTVQDAIAGMSALEDEIENEDEDSYDEVQPEIFEMRQKMRKENEKKAPAVEPGKQIGVVQGERPNNREEKEETGGRRKKSKKTRRKTRRRRA